MVNKIQMSRKNEDNIFIFDFDGVFLDTPKFLMEMVRVLGRYGFTPKQVTAEYLANRKPDQPPFSLISFLVSFFPDRPGIIQKLYAELLGCVRSCLNPKMVEFLKKHKRENCFLVTNGEDEFQNDKINWSGLREFFSEVTIVQTNTKKREVEAICARFRDVKNIFFIEDKWQFLRDLDKEKYPNLRTYQYEGLVTLNHIELESGGPGFQEFRKYGSRIFKLFGN